MTESSGGPGPLARPPLFGFELRARRELSLYGGALVLGLVVMPLLIWLVGHRILGPYSHGEDPRGLGPLALYGDYFSGLAHGWLGYWAVALGPAVMLLAVRLWLGLLRRLPRE
ncbi:MAG TPA: hypothetical protein VJ738_12270 [Steroidobacteraceae bacterium]|nr:hypothetical protein [Steroidobacteraceae bacterium]